MCTYINCLIIIILFLLQINAPVFVTIRLDATEGLVKGVLATVVEMHPRTVTIKLATPPTPGRSVWRIPRVCFEFKPPSIPIKIHRYQIPLRLAWDVTVHRVQGDDLDKIVVDLRDPYFVHVQLHVATSKGHHRHETRYLVSAEEMHDDSFETIIV
jgi:hypothetical protein